MNLGVLRVFGKLGPDCFMVGSFSAEEAEEAQKF
jgi:hypothetical protein